MAPYRPADRYIMNPEMGGYLLHRIAPGQIGPGHRIMPIPAALFILDKRLRKWAPLGARDLSKVRSGCALSGCFSNKLFAAQVDLVPQAIPDTRQTDTGTHEVDVTGTRDFPDRTVR